MSGVGESGNVAGGIQASASFVHHAAEINIGADFGVQLAFGNDAPVVVKFSFDERCGFFVAIEMRLLASDFQVATARETAIDIFLADWVD